MEKSSCCNEDIEIGRGEMEEAELQGEAAGEAGEKRVILCKRTERRIDLAGGRPRLSAGAKT